MTGHPGWVTRGVHPKCTRARNTHRFRVITQYFSRWSPENPFDRRPQSRQRTAFQAIRFPLAHNTATDYRNMCCVIYMRDLFLRYIFTVWLWRVSEPRTWGHPYEFGSLSCGGRQIKTNTPGACYKIIINPQIIKLLVCVDRNDRIGCVATWIPQMSISWMLDYVCCRSEVGSENAMFAICENFGAGVNEYTNVCNRDKLYWCINDMIKSTSEFQTGGITPEDRLVDEFQSSRPAGRILSEYDEVYFT